VETVVSSCTLSVQIVHLLPRTLHLECKARFWLRLCHSLNLQIRAMLTTAWPTPRRSGRKRWGFYLLLLTCYLVLVGIIVAIGHLG
jgi:hypothetical protein